MMESGIKMQSTHVLGNLKLASSPWGSVSANGMDLLTEVYVIYMETKPLGPMVLMLQTCTNERTNRRIARKYIRMGTLKIVHH